MTGLAVDVVGTVLFVAIVETVGVTVAMPDLRNAQTWGKRQKLFSFGQNLFSHKFWSLA